MSSYRIAAHCGSCARNLCRACSAEMKAGVSWQACAELPPGQTSPIRAAVLGTALRLLYLGGLRAGELLRLTQADLDLEPGCCISVTASSTSRECSACAGSGPAHSAVPDAATPSTTEIGLSDTPLFPSPRGGRYSITALREAFHDALKIAGIERTTG